MMMVETELKPSAIAGLGVFLKQPVKKGDLIAVVESDKANVELESFDAGILLEQLVAAAPAGAHLPHPGGLGLRAAQHDD